jgi:hypothetical protein
VYVGDLDYAHFALLARFTSGHYVASQNGKKGPQDPARRRN